MIAHRRYGTWYLHSKGAVPGRGLNIIFWGEREFPGIDRKLKKIILYGNSRIICGNLRSDIFLEGTAIISNCPAI